MVPAMSCHAVSPNQKKGSPSSVSENAQLMHADPGQSLPLPRKRRGLLRIRLGPFGTRCPHQGCGSCFQEAAPGRQTHSDNPHISFRSPAGSAIPVIQTQERAKDLLFALRVNSGCHIPVFFARCGIPRPQIRRLAASWLYGCDKDIPGQELAKSNGTAVPARA